MEKREREGWKEKRGNNGVRKESYDCGRNFRRKGKRNKRKTWEEGINERVKKEEGRKV